MDTDFGVSSDKGAFRLFMLHGFVIMNQEHFQEQLHQNEQQAAKKAVCMEQVQETVEWWRRRVHIKWVYDAYWDWETDPDDPGAHVHHIGIQQPACPSAIFVPKFILFSKCARRLTFADLLAGPGVF